MKNKIRSIRWRLPLTYAGVALVTALILGGSLLLILRHYYAEQEMDYMRNNARALSAAVAPLLQANPLPEGLQDHVALYALLTHTRVQIFDLAGQSLADSGSVLDNGVITVSAFSMPAAVDVAQATGSESSLSSTWKMAAGADQATLAISIPDTLAQPITLPLSGQANQLTLFYTPTEGGDQLTQPLTIQTETHGSVSTATTLVSVAPVVDTLYGYQLFTDRPVTSSRSPEKVSQNILGGEGKNLGFVVVSQGPAYGSEILSGVAQGWLLASLLAVAAAAGLGWWFSRKITAPVVALAAATQTMAQGDLSVRAAVSTPDEFGELGQSFNRMAARVEETICALRRFASDAAHELQTPLTALRTNLELALAAPGSAPVDPALSAAWDQAQRLQALTADLLDLSRIENGAAAEAPRLVDLACLVAGAAESAASQAEQRGLTFSLTLPDQPVWTRGWPEQLSRAVGNLLENALKFCRPEGAVQASLAVEGDQAVLSVQDNGLGIPSDELPSLFQRFHRGRNAAGYPGSGLGLAIVKAIADRHAGSVSAGCVPGPGEGEAWTRFTLRLPLCAGLEPQDPGAPADIQG